jgi:uncharacterized protein (DUF1810 family)
VSLQRFLDAQQDVYPAALAELRAGTKRSHWMWFVFPQLAGLGRSATARRFAIRDLAEARAYLAEPTLRARLVEASRAVGDWAGKRSLEAIFGEIDALKFVSSLTLFEQVASAADRGVFAGALDGLAAGRRDAGTLGLLGLTCRS